MCNGKKNIEQGQREQKIQDWEAVHDFKLDCQIGLFKKMTFQKSLKEMKELATQISGKRETQAKGKDKPQR